MFNFQKIYNFSRIQKTLILLLFDILISIISILLICFAFLYIGIFKKDYLNLLIIVAIFVQTCFWFFGIYKILNRESIIFLFFKAYLISFLTIILFFIFDFFFNIQFFVTTVIFFNITFLLLFSFFRIIIVNLYNLNFTNKNSKKIIFIYGVGEAGKYLLKEIQKKYFRPNIIFIDDDPQKQNMIFDGFKVFSPKHIDNYSSNNYDIELILAMPSISKSERIKIINKLSKKNIKILSVPSLFDISTGKNFESLDNIDLSDLLDHSTPDITINSNFYKGKSIMITGSGGTIGGGLSEKIISLLPEELILVDISEQGLFQIMNRISNYKKKFNLKTNIYFYLNSVSDFDEMSLLFQKHKINYVFHAAAFKHVHIIQENLLSAVKNNVLSTKILCDLSMKHNVDKFLFVSSDKAVRPTNILGACKRVAEHYVRASNNRDKSKTIFFTVRFGNVLGSSGSAFNTFNEKIKKKESIQITDINMTRYFMTLDQAVSLLLKTQEISNGGESYVYDMGEPYKIFELVKKLANLYGLTIGKIPNEDLNLEIVGLRKGEKLYEEIFVKTDEIKVIYNNIFEAKEPYFQFDKIYEYFEKLQVFYKKKDINGINKIFEELVENYKSTH